MNDHPTPSATPPDVASLVRQSIDEFNIARDTLAGALRVGNALEAHVLRARLDEARQLVNDLRELHAALQVTS